MANKNLLFNKNYTFRVSVRLGEHNTNTNPDCTSSGDSKFCIPSHIDIPVEERIIHEGYDPDNSNQYHDIGLLRLSKDVQFTGIYRVLN